MRYTDSYEGVTSGDLVTTSGTSISVTGATTTGSTRLVAAIATNSIDGQTSNQASSSWPSDDVDVTSEAFFVWAQNSTGVGGGLASGSGQLASAGSSGNFTSTWNTSTDRQACLSFAMYGSSTPSLYDSTTGAGTNNVVVTLPIAGSNFYYFILVQTANETVNISAGTGWTKIGEVGTGTAGAAGSTRLTIFAADKDSSPTAPTLTIPDDVYVPGFAPQAAVPVRRRASAALAVAAMVSPLLPPDPPAMSWSPRYVDAARRIPTALIVGGQAPGPVDPIPDPAPPSAPDPWFPIYPSSAPGHRPRIAGGASMPELPYQDAPELAWAPRYVDRMDRPLVRYQGWSVCPSIDTSSPDVGGYDWGPAFPSLALPARRNPFGSHVIPLSFAGTALTIGSASCEQKIFGASPETGTWTTYSTNISISTVTHASDLFTSTAHGMKTGDGPYRFSTTGTLPAGLSSATDYYVDREDADTFKVSTSAANALAGTNVSISDDGSGTLTLVRAINTAPLGSAIIAFGARGYWNLDGSAPTDNKGNTFTAVAGSPRAYTGYPTASCWVGVKFDAAGGTGHTTSLTYVNYDEPTVGLIEVNGATFLQDSSHVQRTGAATITSDVVTATANAILIAFVFGGGPVGQDHTWTFLDGFTKIPAASDEGNISANGYIQVAAAYRIVGPGQYSFRAQGISNEGGHMFLLALQAETSSVPAFDWFRPPSIPVRRILPRPVGGSFHQLLTNYETAGAFDWFRQTTDVLRRSSSVARGGSVEPLAEAAEPSLAWSSRWPDILLRAPTWRPLGGETSTPRDTDPGELPTWRGVYPDAIARRNRAAEGWAAATIDPPPPPELAWSPVYPDRAPGKQPINVGPALAQSPADYGPAPESSWSPEFFDVIRRIPRALIVGGQAPGPVDPIPNPPAPELSWSPTFPAWHSRASRWRPVVDPPIGWFAAVVTSTYITGRLYVDAIDRQWSLDQIDVNRWDVAVADSQWSVEVD